MYTLTVEERELQITKIAIALMGTSYDPYVGVQKDSAFYMVASIEVARMERIMALIKS